MNFFKKKYACYVLSLATLISFVYAKNQEEHVTANEITKNYLNDPSKVDFKCSGRYFDNLVFRQFIDLNISGSSQYTEKQFAQILENIVENNNFQEDIVLIVDLRGEAHIFAKHQLKDNKGNDLAISGEPVTIVDKRNREITYDLEEKIIDNLQDLSINIVPHRYAVEFANVDGEVESRNPFTIIATKEDGIGKIETEKEMVERVAKNIQIQPKTDLYSTKSGVKVEYVRIPIKDLSVPTMEQVDKFINSVKQIEKDNPNKRVWIHVHCHGGLGRTAFFMNIAAMIRSDKNLQEIESKQVKSGGRALLDIEHPEIGQSLDDAKGVKAAITEAYNKIRGVVA